MPTAILSGMATRRLAHEVRIAHRRRADDDPRDAFGEPALDGLHVADAAAELHRDRHAPQDRLDGVRVHGLAGEGAVEIDDVEPFEALRLEARGLRRRIVAEHRRLLHVALDEPHAAAVLEVDRRKQDQGRHFRKFAISARPSFWLFSGWNCVPAMLSRATTAVSGPP